MRRTAIACALALLAGWLVASPDDRWAEVADELLAKQRWLLQDLEKVENACRTISDYKQTRESGLYEITPEEERFERKAKENFQIFLERARNCTLESLQLLDVALGAKTKDPLETVFGKALHEVIEVDFEDQALEEVVSQLEATYGVAIHVRGDCFSRKIMSLRGQMSLRSILDHMEQVFCVRLVVEDGKLWFVPTGKPAEAE